MWNLVERSCGWPVDAGRTCGKYFTASRASAERAIQFFLDFFATHRLHRKMFIAKLSKYFIDGCGFTVDKAALKGQTLRLSLKRQVWAERVIDAGSSAGVRGWPCSCRSNSFLGDIPCLMIRSSNNLSDQVGLIIPGRMHIYHPRDMRSMRNFKSCRSSSPLRR
jgi:hypothetical protein